MKTASLPPVRAEAELLVQVEGLLQPGESLSGFVENAVLQAVQQRVQQSELVTRGMAASAKARRTGKLIESDAVMA